MTMFQTEEMRSRWFERLERKKDEQKKASKIRYQELKAKKEEKARKLAAYRARYKERKRQEKEEEEERRRQEEEEVE
jgi:hypothetical protein